MAFIPFVATDAPTMAAFNEKFAQAIAEAEDGAIEKGTKIETGSYVGTGTAGTGNPIVLTFGFEPTLVFVYGGSVGAQLQYGVFVRGAVRTHSNHEPNSTKYTTNTWNGNVLTYYSGDGAYYQMNESGSKFLYVAIG